LEKVGGLIMDANNTEDQFISYVCNAIVAAYKKKVPDHNVEGVRAIFNKETGEIGIFAPKKVVERVTNEYHQISLGDVQDLIPDLTVGKVLEIEVTPADFSEFGRIVAQTSKQLITRRLGEAEKEWIKKEFEARKGTCTTGQIERIEVIGNNLNNVIINLGRVEGCMPSKEQLPGETYTVGNRVRVYVLELRKTERIPQIIVSQARPELVRELLELYVPEIEDGTVEIKSIAREAGYRTKIAVHSNDADVDSVDTCIGPRGAHIHNVVAELGNEKIDVIYYSANPIDYISNALSPAQITTVELYDDPPEMGGKRAKVIVPDDQLKLAIGPGRQNVQLAAKLTNWKIIVKSESQAHEKPDK
jgi:transcription termination/antitermination protein NusA